MSSIFTGRPTYKSVGILMIATNKYIERWKSIAEDLERNAFKEIDVVTIHLFTNEVSSAQDFALKHLKRIKISIHQTQGWGWPEATLFRYKFFTENMDSIQEELLVYLDSDMRVIGDFGNITNQLFEGDGIGVVSHPGYYRLNLRKRFKEYITSPRIAISDLKVGLRNSWNLGAWETNKLSQAYVPRSLRTTYVHGAIWFAHHNEFFDMCESLASATEVDFKKGYIAKWHDESHLNCYITKKPHKIFDNRLSFVYGYPQIERFAENYLISNVEKNPGEGRDPSNA